MAKSPASKAPVVARVDRDGRLVSAEPELLRLQQAAGSDLGRPLALPQLAALARSAMTLVVPLSRNVLAADEDQDLDLWVKAEPDADGVTLSVERWKVRAPAAPRLALVDRNGEPDDADATAAESEPLNWSADAELHFTEVSPALAELLGSSEQQAVGKPLTRLFRLVEDEDGRMPLLAALAAREDIVGQRAQARNDEGETLILSAQPRFDADGKFAGFSGRAQREGATDNEPSDGEPMLIDHALDEALRSPLDRIIDAADRIVERGDGPLRSDYASYASDIAAAGRHLLSVIRAMSDEQPSDASSVDIVAVVDEAVGLVEPAAEARRVEIAVQPPEERLVAKGEARGVVQILVNIVGNAVRHSTAGGTVAITFEGKPGRIAVTITDRGPGIATADQQRIFERYERVATTTDGAGLGLAISRRLARSMDGDISLISAPGEGASFTLWLPAA